MIRQYLHTHHMDGVKSNNNFSTLKCLCINCHEKQPGHEHLRFHPDYKRFIDKYLYFK